MTKYIPDFDGLRGVLALCVVALHFGVNNFAMRMFGSPVAVFELSVDIFFMLSGYVLVASYKGHKAHQFFVKRPFRLVPVFAVTTLLMMTYVDRYVHWSELFLGAPIFGEIPLNYPSWSITYELYLPVLAYLIVPVFVLPRKIALTVALVGLAVTSVFVAQGEHLFALRAIFGLTVGAYLYGLRWNGPVYPLTIGLFSLFVLSAHWPLVAAATPFVGAALIVALVEQRSIFASRPAQIAGDYSYTIYMAHIPALLLFPDEALVYKAIAFATTIVFAVALTHLVERPGIRMGKYIANRGSAPRAAKAGV